jgi:hypothetical protein
MSVTAVPTNAQLTQATPPARGCILTLLAWLGLNAVLAAILLGIFVLYARPILTHLAQVTFATVAPYYLALLDQQHSAAERCAFSNAYQQVTALIATNALVFTPPPVLQTFNGLMFATKDQLITRAESAHFVSNAAALAVAPASPSPEHTP